MKKYYAIAAIAALSLFPCAAQADITATPAPAVTAPADSPAAQAYRAKAMELLSILDEITELLKGVKDKATADAAAEPLKALMAKGEALAAEGEAISAQYPGFEESPEGIALQTELAAGAEAKMKAFAEEILRIAFSGAYGSEDFMKVLESANPGM